MHSRPMVPSGYRDDFAFEQAYLEYALSVLEQRCLALALSSSRQLATYTTELADDLTVCATKVAHDFCARDFAEDGLIGVTACRAPSSSGATTSPSTLLLLLRESNVSCGAIT